LTDPIGRRRVERVERSSAANEIETELEDEDEDEREGLTPGHAPGGEPFGIRGARWL
jgi:hypothetical protein